PSLRDRHPKGAAVVVARSDRRRNAHAFWQGRAPAPPLGWGGCPSSGENSMRRLVLTALSLAVAGLVHAEVPAPRDVPYAPGMIKIEIDATNLSQRIFRVK